MRKIFSILLAGFCFLSVHAQQQSFHSNLKHHVVMELTGSDTLIWKGAINNIRHLKEEWGENVEIELVAHGPGISFLQKDKTTQLSAMEELRKSGVVFAACNNSMKARNISLADLVSQATVVPSGVAEIVTKQEQGWSYLKTSF